MKQFDDVFCKYGAPMGRAEYGNIDDCSNKSIALFRVNLIDGDYDDGGAYWGGYPSLPLYCARTDDNTYRVFIRAKNRREAIKVSAIPARLLKRA